MCLRSSPMVVAEDNWPEVFRTLKSSLRTEYVNCLYERSRDWSNVELRIEETRRLGASLVAVADLDRSCNGRLSYNLWGTKKSARVPRDVVPVPIRTE